MHCCKPCMRVLPRKIYCCMCLCESMASCVMSASISSTVQVRVDMQWPYSGIMTHPSIQNLVFKVTLPTLHSIPVVRTHVGQHMELRITNMVNASWTISKRLSSSATRSKTSQTATAQPSSRSARYTLHALTKLQVGLLVGLMVRQAQAVPPVPAGLTELSSAGGSQLLQDTQPSDAFWNLTQEFVTQDSQDWCGLASASMVLNALPIPKPSVHAFAG